MTLRIKLSMIFAAMLLANEATAHHNMTALFDFNDRVTLAGPLTMVDWRNPLVGKLCRPVLKTVRHWRWL